MNILGILSILVPTSSLWEVKMLKVLKKIICQNLSGLLGASTVSRTVRAATCVTQIIRIGVIEEYAIPPPHQRNGSGVLRQPPNTPVGRERVACGASLPGEKRDLARIIHEAEFR
jgi:hypothetical protein